MTRVVYLNDNFVKENEACLSPNDRGFIFADGVYEVTKYYKGKAFRMNDHIERLKRSLNEIGIHFEGIDKLESISAELLKRNKLADEDAGVYWQITRGVHQRVHHFPKDIQPTLYAFAQALPSATEKLQKGIKTILREDIRWQRCDIKSISLLPNTMLYNETVEKGAGECILIRDGFVTEATHSSLIAVKNGILITRPLSNLILPGITRKVVMELGATHQIPVEERLFSKEELLDMDEVFICGTGSEIMPVVQIEDHSIGDGVPGQLTRNIQQLFTELTR
ncbi:D-amino-acid transaminase [Maribellus mangrovi]|uniref:D-amino-acid transaminase n=1 Tax=Maribellus mangrovi TaxID=3133146 RepID=UPI0030EE6340